MLLGEFQNREKLWEIMKQKVVVAMEGISKGMVLLDKGRDEGVGNLPQITPGDSILINVYTVIKIGIGKRIVHS